MVVNNVSPTSYLPPTKPLVVIVGETASGKSAAAMELAQIIGGEIIAADSWTVYKGFDIGTAKPTHEDREAIRHHLLDVAEPGQGFSAATFKRLAQQVISEIHARGKIPILVGGSGLYIDSVLYDYDFLPAGSATERRRLDTMDLAELQSEATTKGININNIDTENKRRVIRAIESGGESVSRKPLRANTIIVGLRPSADILQQRIVQRVDVMLKNGLEDEVTILSKLHGWDAPAMQGIGYIEWREYFEGTQSIADTRSRIISSTRRLTKKQRTWFKRNESIQWMDNSSDVVVTVTSLLNKKT